MIVEIHFIPNIQGCASNTATIQSSLISSSTFYGLKSFKRDD